ncbi:MAG: histidine phosphatase family protein [Saprospiraceae bacterium]|nr:histidine phosphatase family protein [Saprospiraceae bacterium]
MQRTIFKCFVVTLTLMAFMMMSCTPETEIIDFNGKRVKEIISNMVVTEDSQRLVLNEDSISKIFYLIRHAEKDTSVKTEPLLSEAGLLRATRLADIMRGTRVDAIYSTMTLRTMFTVDSLADIKAMTILPYDNKTIKETMESIRKSDEFNRIFIVGHSNTIPSITNSLAGRDIFTKTFNESDYENFIIVVANKSGTTDVYTLKY